MLNMTKITITIINYFHAKHFNSFSIFVVGWDQNSFSEQFPF